MFCVSLLFSSATSPFPQTLGLRSRLELSLPDHRAVAVIFQLECVFSAPIGRETMVRDLGGSAKPNANLQPRTGWHQPQHKPKWARKAGLIDVEGHACKQMCTERLRQRERNGDLSLSRLCSLTTWILCLEYHPLHFSSVSPRGNYCILGCKFSVNSQDWKGCR